MFLATHWPLGFQGFLGDFSSPLVEAVSRGQVQTGDCFCECREDAAFTALCKSTTAPQQHAAVASPASAPMAGHKKTRKAVKKHVQAHHKIPKFKMHELGPVPNFLSPEWDLRIKTKPLLFRGCR